jgi:hypothetical protein
VHRSYVKTARQRLVRLAPMIRRKPAPMGGLAFFLLCSAPGLVAAQEPVKAVVSSDPITSLTSPAQPPLSPHRFFDTPNNILTAAAFGAQLGDAGSTLRAIRKYGGGEANPLARPFIAAGWPGVVAGVSLLVSADVGLRYWLHRTDHHRLERFVPTFLIVTGTEGTIRNVRAMNRLEREYGRR